MMSDDQNPMSRRGFVQTAALAAGTLAATDLTRAAAPAADVKIGLYSITYGGVWYRGDALTVDQVIARPGEVAALELHPAEQDEQLPHFGPGVGTKARQAQKLLQLGRQGYGVVVRARTGHRGSQFRHPLAKSRQFWIHRQPIEFRWPKAIEGSHGGIASSVRPSS